MLEGSLDAFSLPDIFALLSMTKKTGGLHLRRGDAHGVVWLTTGALTGGASDVTRQALARRVVGTGHVDETSLLAAVTRSAEDDAVGVTRALHEAGAVDESTLHDVVSEHVVDTVFDLLRWPDGDFAFVVDEPNPDDVGISRDIDDVVAEARRRLDAWGSVAATVPSPKTVLSLAPNPPDDPALSRAEWTLLALVDGRRSVGDIVALAGRGEFAVVSSLAELVSRGLLRLDDADGVAALLRRHDVLSQLEGGAAASASEVAPPATARDDVVVEEVVFGEDDDVTLAGGLPSAVANPVAEVTQLLASPQPVTPSRPEAVLPKRRPVHPEELPPAVAALAGGGAAAPSPAAAALIERDPSVNKSLLLRLIAGVQGL